MSSTSGDHRLGSGRVRVRDVDVRFIGANGLPEQRSWLEVAAELVPADCPPVRGFVVRRGKGLAPGWWWAATTGRLVAYGSTAMRDRLMLLDRDRQVVGLACRPLEFVWRDGGRVVAHAPQLAARLADGGHVLVDCHGAGGPPRRLACVQAVLEECVQEAGWEYRVEPAADPVVVANVRWLSGYRHPRCAGGVRPGRLRDVFACRRSLVEGAAALGDVVRTLPVVYHGLWSGELTAALDRPLTEGTLVAAAGRRGR
ncbi:TnsA-like heteromeric transposase endonuclease subunit [Streptomyces sp. NPDC020192]|uniref:TnsA-like heteromeric transposase endonuclease subunit n=1 Tax=Streptomyces sp. NPDC020192 TaxID=3365066 RepID=UPI00379ACE1F